MVVQAIALLDDLDKEINLYAMRVKVSRYSMFKCLGGKSERIFYIKGMVWMAFPRNG